MTSIFILKLITMSLWRMKIEFQIAYMIADEPNYKTNEYHWFDDITANQVLEPVTHSQNFKCYWEYDTQNKYNLCIDPPIDFIDLHFDVNTNNITDRGLSKIDKNFIKEHHFETYNHFKLEQKNIDLKATAVYLINISPKISFMRDYYNEKKERIESIIYKPCKSGPECKNRLMCRYIH